MARYVLFSRAKLPSAEERREIVAFPGVTVIEDDHERSLLIEACPEVAEDLRARHPSWVIGAEVVYPRPRERRASVSGEPLPDPLDDDPTRS